VIILSIFQIQPLINSAKKEALMVPLEPLIGKKNIMELGVTSLISLVLIGILGDMVNSQINVIQE
jgi:hypothetical protein